jgi:hypothetical protein
LKGKKNGELLRAAEFAGYDVLLAVDQGIPHQQRSADRKLSIILRNLSTLIVRMAEPGMSRASICGQSVETPVPFPGGGDSVDQGKSPIRRFPGQRIAGLRASRWLPGVRRYAHHAGAT